MCHQGWLSGVISRKLRTQCGNLCNLPPTELRLISPSTFRDVVSGRRQSLVAAVLRSGLRIAEFPYTWAMNWRNRQYDSGAADIATVEVPVVCVGNLSLGGTGKTPMVEWVCRVLRQSDVRVSIVSRGYGAGHQGRNDEALELELALPDVPHLQNADRAAAARIAMEELETQFIVLDDGFQHRQLHRDLDFVLLDATEPFGFEHVFPRGTLREPLASLVRANIVALSRADMIDQQSRNAIRERVAQLAPQATWCEVSHNPRSLRNSRGEVEDLHYLKGRSVAAFCAIGNPVGFRHTLETLDAEVVAWREFPDHHQFTCADVHQLNNWAEDVDVVVCTRKDLVKLQVTSLGNTPLWSVGVELEFQAGEQQVREQLLTLASRIERSSVESTPEREG